MKRKQFTEEQIIGILKEAQAGAVVTELPAAAHSASPGRHHDQPQEDPAALPRGGADGQAQEGTKARRGRAGTGTGVGSSQPALEPGPFDKLRRAFVHDQLVTGRRFRVLNIVDDVTRECLAAVVDTSISGRRVVRELDDLIARRGAPKMIVSDNPVLSLPKGAPSSPRTRCWRGRVMPASSGIISRRASQRRTGSSRGWASPAFGPNGRMRDELLDETLFFTVGQACAILARWAHDYNTERPHSSLGYATPAAFAAELEQQRAGLTPPVASPALMRNNTRGSLVAAG